jgi:hypothetical protein
MRANHVSCLFIYGSLVFAQNDTKAPEGQRVVLTVSAKGVQIYSCEKGQWVFQAPEATLFDSSGKEIGTHSAGPVWAFRDGRQVKGQVVAKGDAPAAGDIPWLLLKGVGEAGKTARVQYSANYTFYLSK